MHTLEKEILDLEIQFWKSMRDKNIDAALNRTGYKVVRVLFEDGKPTGECEDFITGFAISDEQVWGRPVGLTVGGDGSLFLTEDGSGSIWRIRHE